MLYNLKKKKKRKKIKNKRPVGWKSPHDPQSNPGSSNWSKFPNWLHVFLKWQVCENEAQPLIKDFILLLKLQKNGGICCTGSNLVPLAESKRRMKRFPTPAKLWFPPCFLADKNLQEWSERKMNARMCAKLPGVCNLLFLALASRAKDREAKFTQRDKSKRCPVPGCFCDCA